MGLAAQALAITDREGAELEKLTRAHSTPRQGAPRARILLLAAAGISNSEIARRLETTRPTVLDWRKRFEAERFDGLTWVRPGRGRKPSISAEKVRSIVDATLHTKPVNATHWSCRTMARAQGVSPATVQRIWNAHGLQPHRVKTFKVSRDPEFVDKLTDVVGLYLNPPDKALLLCVDEKSQMQAPRRTQPGLPLKKGRCGTLTHDYKRHGTTTLFAALNVLDGTVVGQCQARHRHQEFLKFLRRLDKEFPRRELHLILDNYGTHKHPKVRDWLAKRPRFVLHFTPTSASWLNLVERWFRELTDKRIRRGVFHSVAELTAAIEAYIENHNQDPKPFVWSATADRIIQKVSKCKAILETLH
jgi:transposase